MTLEELETCNNMNLKLSRRGLKSRLSYLYVGGFHEGLITEWGFEQEIKEESVEANILVSEEIARIVQ